MSFPQSENLPPRTLARLAREVRDLQKSPPEGTKLVVDSDSGLPSNLGELMAELEGPTGTPYEGKCFRLKLVFPSQFPHQPPRGFFLTKIYHPNVDMSTGAICVNTLKRDWTPETTVPHILGVIRCLLIVPFPESSLNEEAGKLFMESYDEYSKRARLMADVHGRPSKQQQQLQSESRVLKSSSDKTNHNTTVKPADASSTTKKAVSATGKSKTMSKTMSKKKSLKRL